MVKTAGDERKDTAELQVLNRTTTTLLEDRRGALCAKSAIFAIAPPAAALRFPKDIAGGGR
jgi:hypothetical protein